MLQAKSCAPIPGMVLRGFETEGFVLGSMPAKPAFQPGLPWHRTPLPVEWGF
jgi:hypothetical protein